MRIAAGVLLIILAVFYLIGGAAGALLGGGAAAGADLMKEQVAQAEAELEKKKKAKASEVEIAMAETNLKTAKEAVAAVGDAGGNLFLIGLAYLITSIFQIAGAVVLFRQKAAKFAMAVGGITVLCGAILPLALGGGFGFGAIAAVVVAVLTFLGAKSYADGGAAPAQA